MEDIYGATLVAGDDEVVWGKFEERGGTGSRLYLYRLTWSDAVPVEIPTTYEPYAAFRAISVSGDKVAYAAKTDSGFKIWVRDWAHETEVAVSSVVSDQYNPAIAGDMVAWRDGRNSSGYNYSDIYSNRALPVEPSVITTTSPSVTLAKYGDTYAITGTLESGGAGLVGKTVVLQKATSASGPFADTSVTATTAADGAFSLACGPTSRNYYQAHFAGDAEYDAATGSPVSVLPRALVGNPVAASIMYANQGKTVYGFLKPYHMSGTSPVRIHRYRSVSGVWKPYSYVNSKAYGYSTYTKYKATVKLPYKGKWRLRA